MALLSAIFYQIKIIYPYINFSYFKSPKTQDLDSCISIISVNVLQYNNSYNKLIDLVEAYHPNILVTFETDEKWGKALSKIEKHYPNNINIPQDNTYGIHFYTNLRVIKFVKHHLISSEVPSIEAHLIDNENRAFIFWGIHPPPPSPTEKATSKQKDAELMLVAKLVRAAKLPCIVTGDFNNVSWSRSSQLFAKVARLKDARLKKGLYGTFPASFPMLRFPLDLLFHSKDFVVNQIQTLRNIDSDHLPLYAVLSLVAENNVVSKPLPTELEEKTDNIIEKGLNEVEAEKE